MLFALALVLVVQRTFLLGSADSTVGSKEASREKALEDAPKPRARPAGPPGASLG